MVQRKRKKDGQTIVSQIGFVFQYSLYHFQTFGPYIPDNMNSSINNTMKACGVYPCCPLMQSMLQSGSGQLTSCLASWPAFSIKTHLNAIWNAFSWKWSPNNAHHYPPTYPNEVPIRLEYFQTVYIEYLLLMSNYSNVKWDFPSPLTNISISHRVTNRILCHSNGISQFERIVCSVSSLSKCTS